MKTPIMSLILHSHRGTEMHTGWRQMEKGISRHRISHHSDSAEAKPSTKLFLCNWTVGILWFLSCFKVVEESLKESRANFALIRRANSALTCRANFALRGPECKKFLLAWMQEFPLRLNAEIAFRPGWKKCIQARGQILHKGLNAHFAHRPGCKNCTLAKRKCSQPIQPDAFRIG